MFSAFLSKQGQRNKALFKPMDFSYLKHSKLGCQLRVLLISSAFALV